MAIKLIGLAGMARSGKDTAGQYLNEKHKFSLYAMAKPMKEACRQMFGWDDRHLHGDLKEVLDPIYKVTPREAMQKLGTEFGRNMINERMWELRALAEIEDNEFLVVTDIRYDNEAQMIRDAGGLVLSIERDTRTNIHGVASHSSEDGVDAELVDWVIFNNSSLENLYQQLDMVLAKEAA